MIDAASAGDILSGTHTVEAVEAAAAVIRARFGTRPGVAIVLGRGLEAVAEEMAVEVAIDPGGIPGFSLTAADGQDARLLCGTLGGQIVVALQGRVHQHEGRSARQVTFPVRVLRALGARTLVVTDSCAGLHPLWAPGDLMLVADHINWLGDNPLVGRNDDRLGGRFPDMSAPYDEPLRTVARAVAAEQRITLREGVFVAVAGPDTETPSECRMLRAMGADAVGTSLVAEVIVGVHAQMRVLGLAVVTDRCLPDRVHATDAATVRAATGRSVSRLRTLVRGVLERLS